VPAHSTQIEASKDIRNGLFSTIAGVVSDIQQGDVGTYVLLGKLFSNFNINLYCLAIRHLTFIIHSLNPNVAIDGQSYFCFECPYLHQHRTVFYFRV
jgi:hypothetical protein